MEKLVFLILLVFSSLFLMFAFFNLAGIITDELHPIVQLLPMLIVCNLPFFYTRYFYSHFFIKPHSEKRGYVFLGITSFLLLFSLIVVCIYYHYYFLNSVHGFSLAVFIVLLLGLGYVNVRYFLSLRKPKETIELRPNVYIISESKTALRGFVWVDIYALSYYLGDGLVAFWRFNNFSLAPFSFPALLLSLILPSVGIFYFLLTDKDYAKRRLFLLISFICTLVAMALILIVYFALFEDVVKVGQNMFFISFATSIPYTIILMFIAQAFMGGALLSDFIRLNKKAGA